MKINLLGVVVLLVLFLQPVFAENEQNFISINEQIRAGGAIWTTEDNCGDEAQDVNHYNIGETVFINGKNFNANTVYNWRIEGKPGGASCDPGAVVESGTHTTNGEGGFCFGAYVVKNDDCGEYTVIFGCDENGNGGKRDNYRVDTAPSIEIEKATNDQDADSPKGPMIVVGQKVTWTYLITNTGNTLLKDIRVTDDVIGLIGEDITLDVGQSTTITIKGTAQAGQYANVATVEGSGGGETVTDSDPSHYFGANPDIDLEKSTNGNDADTAPGIYLKIGDDITWEYVVTNTGNVPLSDIVVTDSEEGKVCTIESLGVGESATCTVTGTVEEEGQYTNEAEACGIDEGTQTEVCDTDPSNYYGSEGPQPAIDIEKYTNDLDADTKPEAPYILVGDPVQWKFIVTNTGTVDLEGVTVIDNKLGEVCEEPFDLPAGESHTCIVDGTAQKGWHANTAEACAKYEDEVVCDEDISRYFGADPSLDIEKATNGEDADDPEGPKIVVGEDVVWTYKVTNTGNVNLDNISVIDDKTGLVDVISLKKGKSTILTRTGTAVAGQYVNVGTAVTTYLDKEVKDTDPSHYIGAGAGIDIEKHTNGEDADEAPGPNIIVGDPVVWEYIVTNIGDVDLEGVLVMDDILGQVCPPFDLAIGESHTCKIKRRAKEGPYENLGIATADVGKQKVEDTDPSHYYGRKYGCIHGYVTINGKPAKVVVRLETEGEKTSKHWTDDEGYFVFENVLLKTPYTLSVDGYPDQTIEFTLEEWRSGCKRFNFELAGCKDVFGWYEPWFGDENNNTPWRHWKEEAMGGTVDTPDIGLYDSLDPDALEYHVLSAWSADIDAFVVDWYGKESYEHLVTLQLLDVVDNLNELFGNIGFEFRVIVSYNGKADGTLEDNLKLLATTVLPHPAYYGTGTNNPKPLFVHAATTQMSPKVFKEAVETHIPQPVKIVWNWNEQQVDLSGNVDGVYPWVQASNDEWDDTNGLEWGNDYLEAFYTSAFASTDCFTGGTWPGYDDREWVNGMNHWMDRQNKMVYSHTWDKALMYQPPWLLVESWNDFNRSTHVEYSDLYGYDYLMLTRTKAAEWKKICAHDVTDEGVPVPVQVYHARKAGMDELHIIEALQAFFKKKYSLALDLLNPATDPPKRDDSAMIFIKGSETYCHGYEDYNWSNLFDGDLEGYDGTVIARDASDPVAPAWAIFRFADGDIWTFNYVTLQTNTTGVPERDEVKLFEIWVSTTTDDMDDFTLVKQIQRRGDGTEEYYPLGDTQARYVMVKFVKPVLRKIGGWRKAVEMRLESSSKTGPWKSDGTTDLVEVPMEYQLSQNYPNPFNPGTTIEFQLPQASEVTLQVYDIQGRLIETLLNMNMEAGNHQVTWEAADKPSGIYIYRLSTSSFNATRRMILLK